MEDTERETHFIATLHPSLVETKSPNYNGDFFTRKEKEKQVIAFYRKKQKIPLCIDHCGANSCHFVVPDKERIGYVDDLFIGKKGDLMVKLSLDNKHAYFPRISQDIHSGKSWGVSVWIENNRTLKNKELTHVALTTDPYFASRNTFLHKFDFNDRNIMRAIGRQYYKEGEGECFATREFKQKLHSMYALRAHPP
jgi:hypothetical protein